MSGEGNSFVEVVNVFGSQRWLMNRSGARISTTRPPTGRASTTWVIKPIVNASPLIDDPPGHPVEFLLAV